MLALKNIYFVFSKTVIILFITDLSLSVKSSYWSIISGDLIRSLNKSNRRTICGITNIYGIIYTYSCFSCFYL